jgi:hypothetical protein
MRFSKPRYSLATLLFVVTATAVLLWAVPAWRDYQQRLEFERALCELRIGAYDGLLRQVKFPRSVKDWFNLLNLGGAHQEFTGGRFRQQFVPFVVGRYWYVVWIDHEEIPTFTSPGPMVGSVERWTMVRVYRLAAAPLEYAARSVDAQQKVAQALSKNKGEPDSKLQYLWDFYAMITGRAAAESGIRYKLVHADPPLSPE